MSRIITYSWHNRWECHSKINVSDNAMPMATGSNKDLHRAFYCEPCLTFPSCVPKHHLLTLQHHTATSGRHNYYVGDIIVLVENVWFSKQGLYRETKMWITLQVIFSIWRLLLSFTFNSSLSRSTEEFTETRHFKGHQMDFEKNNVVNIGFFLPVARLRRLEHSLDWSQSEMH